MKKLMFMLLILGSIQGVYAQRTEKSKKFMVDKTLFEELTDVKKKSDKFNLYLNMQGGFDANFRDGFEEGAFKMRQLRIEMKGNINNWLSYRYRQRLNRSNDGGGMIDNVPTSIDYAGIGIKLNNRFNLFAGKQCTAYGGIEFDLNPIDIYEYSDIIENMSNFMTGLNIGYNLTSTQQLNLQILNSRNGSFDSTYGITENEEGKLPDLKSGKLPLVYTLNWNGTFNDIFKTRWSASILNEAKSKNMYYYALGNELNLDKFNMFLDFMYAQEGIDRNGTITGIVGRPSGHNVFDTGYLSVVTKLNYRFLPKWNVFVKGMYETASVTKSTEDIAKGNYRTSWGYLAGVEYYPMETNLHFFLTYVGRSYNFTSRAKILGQENYSTNRISVGFIWQMPVF
ncbi:OprO/OprP family phosphate-selective porin [Bacteroides salyersiae]|jgi:opacity protein-like surface antigen|uniref:porin n=1 Tax=Bacteroides salyersiae TaxID=291644 RepID=UPI001CCC93A0|nr:porin [Bacteroides salyersiae]MBS4850993.1 OprO/OprP family phosphate-selective porin [Bacteroides salyersiae]UBD65679.1 OprO/OprP family phosphate-selective porin [Bacteroides salyersiae]